ncbi:NAD(P)H-binding protein [Herbiconiux sp. CPCC 205763]|uniref:NAD(P)H-binding protein n=1 Tax=Herbiconiux aconitum TaxID=2970913 RepID=A0ABT2GT69_9MICO|nr:NAD(P)H-binding protein [Herbiconiux aconitum]MCS5719331.1 NAD(P)H-binding protein [Herbiconiux aconitum]
MHIVTVGGTGTTGVPLVNDLLGAGVHVKVLTRDAARAREVLHDSDLLTLATPDFADAEAVAGEMRGADAAFVAMLALGPDGETSRRVLTAAHEAGVPYVLRISVLSASPTSLALNQRSHAAIDEFAASLAFAYTALRPALFMTSVLAVAADIRATGSWSQSATTGRNPLVDPLDVSLVAARILRRPELRDPVIEVTGPQILSWPDVAEILTGVLGKPVSYVPIPEDTMLSRLADKGVPELMREVAASRDQANDAGENDRLSSAVMSILGRPPRDLGSYLRDHRSSFQ